MTHVTHLRPEAASHGPALVPKRTSAHAFPLRHQLRRPPPVANHRPPLPGGIRQPSLPIGLSACSIPVPLSLSLRRTIIFSFFHLHRSPVFIVAVTEDSSSYLLPSAFATLSHPCPSFKSPPPHPPFFSFPPSFSLLDYRPCSFVPFY